MITKTIERYSPLTETWTDITAQCQEPLTITERRDMELDDGDFIFVEYNNETSKAVEPFTLFRVTLNDGVNAPITAYFDGAGQRALLRNKWGNGANNSQKALFRHTVALTEKTKDTQGVLIDGFAVTQDENESVTLLDVVERLLAVTPVKAVGDTETERYGLTDDERVLSVLRNTKAPEFKWNCQSTLWECLCEIGDTIGAVPKVMLEIDIPAPENITLQVWLERSGTNWVARKIVSSNTNDYSVVLNWEASDIETQEVLETGTLTGAEAIPTGTRTSEAQGVVEDYGLDFVMWIERGYSDCNFRFWAVNTEQEESEISTMGVGENAYHTV